MDKKNELVMYSNLSTAMDKLEEAQRNQYESNKNNKNQPIDFGEKLESNYKVEIIDMSNFSDSGYQGYAYKEKDKNEIIIVHRGSETPNLSRLEETYKDWGKTNGKILVDKIPEQFYEAKAFVDKIKNQYKNYKIIQVGQSLGGGLSQMIGALEENKDIETITFNAIGAKELEDKLREKYILSNDYSNIENYTYKGELVSKIKDHFGNVYVSDKKDTLNQRHSVEYHYEDFRKYELKEQNDNIHSVLDNILEKANTGYSLSKEHLDLFFNNQKDTSSIKDKIQFAPNKDITNPNQKSKTKVFNINDLTFIVEEQYEFTDQEKEKYTKQAIKETGSIPSTIRVFNIHEFNINSDEEFNKFPKALSQLTRQLAN